MAEMAIINQRGLTKERAQVIVDGWQPILIKCRDDPREEQKEFMNRAKDEGLLFALTWLARN